MHSSPHTHPTHPKSPHLFQAFNAKLKLRFLLDPLDAKPDMIALTARAGTDASQWNLGPVVEWLKAPGGPQVAVLTAAPGTGEGAVGRYGNRRTHGT